jgi:hypothetical protein
MRLLIPCIECWHIIQNTADLGPDGAGLERCGNFVEMRDDSAYFLTCSSGHETLLHVGNPKFELLFDSGALALLDGFLREAVSSLTAALERFYEYYIRVKFEHYGMQPVVFDATWKLVKNQSERQLGAFLFLYLLDTGQTVQLDLKKLSEFRNKVIHQGYIPSRQEVLQFGEQIFTFISSVSQQLRVRNERGIMHVSISEASTVYRGLQKNIPAMTMLIPTILGMYAPREGQTATFEDSLQWLDRLRPFR